MKASLGLHWSISLSLFAPPSHPACPPLSLPFPPSHTLCPFLPPHSASFCLILPHSASSSQGEKTKWVKDPNARQKHQAANFFSDLL